LALPAGSGWSDGFLISATRNASGTSAGKIFRSTVTGHCWENSATRRPPCPLPTVSGRADL